MRPALAFGAVGSLLLMTGCARPAPQPPQAPARDLVVLAPDPDAGALGSLTVSTGSGSTTLTDAYASTTVVAGGPPGPAVPMAEDEVRQIFGAALAVQPPAARRFNLYFETGSDTLTAESKAQLSEVISAVQGRAAPEVGVIGHTDTTGPADANAELGLRRASLIRDQLLQVGLDASLIEVVSHGESDPLVPTPDNTPEARNRRVEVTVR